MSIPPIYPFLNVIKYEKNVNKGQWEANRPLGVTIHYAADRNVERTLSWLKREDLCYHILINREGEIIQTAFLTNTVNHAGHAEWNGLRLNKNHIAIALMSWGKLKEQCGNYYSWSNEKIKKEDTASRPNFKGEIGIWDKATNKQEAVLQKVLSWFLTVGIEPENICGHDEAAIPSGRKEDPGGVLSISVKEIREYFIKEKSKCLA